MTTSTGVTAQERRPLAPRLIVGAVIAYLGVTLALIYAVDVHDAFGLRTRMLGLDMNHPALWYHIYGTRKITEVLQWAALATTAATAGVLGGRLTAIGQRGPGAFWSLVSVLTAFMLMEDAGNPRSIIARYITDLYPQYTREVTLGFTLVIFGVLGALALYALVRHGASVWRVTTVRPYIAVAYIALGIGAISDVSIGFYEAAGLFVHNTLAQGQLVMLEEHTLVTQAGLFMDSVWEEGLELLGYASFLAAAIAYWSTELQHRTMEALDSPSGLPSLAASERRTRG